MKLNEYQNILIDILYVFDEYCRKNNIKYSLFGGTLLGAIRHEGIIPWDDDIDVVVPREDYNRLIAHFSNNRYKIFKPGDKGYYYPFAKLCDLNYQLSEKNRKGESHPFIDIFPADRFDLNYHKKLVRIIRKEVVKGQAKPHFYQTNGLIKKIALKIYLTFEWAVDQLYSQNYLYKRIEKFIFSHKGKDYYMVVWGASSKPIYVFEDNLIEVNFCNRKFFVFKNYCEILTKLYGDFMKPPVKPKPSHNLLINGSEIEYYYE